MIVWLPENLVGLSPGKDVEPAFKEEAEYASML